MNWRPRKQCLQQKSCDEHGQDAIRKSMSLRRARHCIERFLHRPLTEPMDSRNEPCQVKNARVQGGAAGSIPVESFRQPHTLTTLSWSDGELGRGFITCKEDNLSERQRAAPNQETVCQASQDLSRGINTYRYKYIYTYTYICFYLFMHAAVDSLDVACGKAF